MGARQAAARSVLIGLSLAGNYPSQGHLTAREREREREREGERERERERARKEPAKSPQRARREAREETTPSAGT